MKTYHYSVLKEEVIKGLNIKEDGIYVDATVGYAGHAKNILAKIKKGYLYAFDQDERAVNYSKEILSSVSDNFTIFNENFVNLKDTLEKNNITKVDGILFDLGFSSPQIDDAQRGFSFMNDGILDMRMSSKGLSAKDIINDASEEDLTNIFYSYGEEKLSKVIAKKIVQKRKEKEIIKTLELVEIIKEAVGANYFYKNHPERKIFQALRIKVNDELNVLEKVLPDAIDMLNSKGRICIITFHSLEDKIAKNIIKKYASIPDIVKGLPDIPLEYQPKIKIVNNKPIVASNKEIEENSRSHSAKLRIIERI